MISHIPNSLSQEDIDYILNLPEVVKAKESIDSKNEGKVNFTVNLTPTIKSYLFEKIGLNLTNIDNVPMRWIKGDTTPHIDRGVSQFNKTHLVYLTDSAGEFIVNNNSYSINKGCGYVFSEGLNHETVGTGSEPRLLLGPMSEQGLAVGGPTIIYIRQSGSIQEFSYDQSSWSTIIWPFSIGSGFTIEFLTDITLNSSDNYLICTGANIQIGSTSLKEDGSRPILTINDVLDYPGLIKNGDNFNSGYNNIYIFNLEVHATPNSTLVSEGGWIGQSYFGLRAINNFIINCSSYGDIPNNCGGIIGSSSTFGNGNQNSASLYILGCSSYGNIGEYSGGIIGSTSGIQGGKIICQNCWSTGSIATNAGGIIGASAAEGIEGFVRAVQCYSIGNIIGDFAGGIFGSYVGNSGTVEAEACYSQGNITGIDAGGIYGSNAAANGGTASAINCYSSGELSGLLNGIYGGGIDTGRTQNNCYVADGVWSDSTANSQLLGVPLSPNIVGDTWVASGGLNYPYELNNLGYTPYNIENIVFQGIDNTPIFNQLYNQTISAGESSIPAIRPGYSYDILNKSGGDQSSYGTITMNDNTGIISTTPATLPGIYTITLRNTGSYNITILELTITPYQGGNDMTPISIPPCCQPICPQFNQTTNNTQQQQSVRQTGIAIASDVDSTYLAINQKKPVNFVQPAFKTYRDYMTYLQSKYR